MVIWLCSCQLEVYKADFAHYDTNANGALDVQEVKLLVAGQLGRPATDHEFRSLLKQFDLSPEGKITLYEYVAVVGSLDGRTARYL